MVRCSVRQQSADRRNRVLEVIEGGAQNGAAGRSADEVLAEGCEMLAAWLSGHACACDDPARVLRMAADCRALSLAGRAQAS